MICDSSSSLWAFSNDPIQSAISRDTIGQSVATELDYIGKCLQCPEAVAIYLLCILLGISSPTRRVIIHERAFLIDRHLLIAKPRWYVRFGASLRLVLRYSKLNRVCGRHDPSLRLWPFVALPLTESGGFPPVAGYGLGVA